MKNKSTGSAMLQLSAAYGRELIRDQKVLAVSTVMPFLLLAVFFGLGFIIPESPGFDFTASMMPLVVVSAAATTAFFGSVSPLVTMRESGTLRLMGMTPLPRRMVLLAFLPSRLALAGTQIFLLAGLVALIAGLGAIEFFQVFVTALLGLLMFAAVGTLIGSRISSAEMTTQILSLVLMVPMISGSLLGLPPGTLPSGAESLLGFLPTTYLLDALLHIIAGAELRYPLLLDYSAVAGVTVLCALIAVSLFRWDVPK